VMHLQRKQQTRSKPPLVTIYGALVSPHYIKTPKGRYFRLIERRDDDQGVYMYWMLTHIKNGKYEVLKRLDPRYCESIEQLHALSHNKACNLLDKIDEQGSKAVQDS
jgi:hypothetical protein